MIEETIISETTPTEETPASSGEKDKKEMPSCTGLTLLRPISIMEQIYKWYPTGLRVTVDLPVVGNDKSFIFLMRAHPLILDPGMCLYYFNSPPSVYGNMFPLRHTSASSETGFTYTNIKNSSVTFVQHSPPPLATYLAMSHARWRGGLSIQDRKSVV